MGWFTEDRAQKQERVERFQQEAHGTYQHQHPQQWRGPARAPPSPPPTPSWEHHAPVSPPASSPAATRSQASTPGFASARARVASPPKSQPATSHPVVSHGWDHGAAVTSASSRVSLDRQLAFRDGDLRAGQPAGGDSTALPPSRAMLASIAALGLDRPRDRHPSPAPAREHDAPSSDSIGSSVADLDSWRASLSEDDRRAVERHRASTSRLLRDANDARAAVERVEAAKARAAERERMRDDPAATAAAAAALAAAYSEYERGGAIDDSGSGSGSGFARVPPRYPGFDPKTSAFANSAFLEKPEASSYADLPAPTGVSPAVPAVHAGVGTVRFTAPPAKPPPEAPPKENETAVERGRASGRGRFDAGPDLRARMAIY